MFESKEAKMIISAVNDFMVDSSIGYKFIKCKPILTNKLKQIEDSLIKSVMKDLSNSYLNKGILDYKTIANSFNTVMSKSYETTHQNEKNMESISFFEKLNTLNLDYELFQIFQAWTMANPGVCSLYKVDLYLPLETALRATFEIASEYFSFTISNSENLITKAYINSLNIDFLKFDEEGLCELHRFSSDDGTYEVIKDYIGKGGDLSIKSRNETYIGYTPLHFATLHNCMGNIHLMVRSGADVNAYADNDGTPLHFAAFNGNLAVVNFLVVNGADINAKDDMDFTPYNIAYNEDQEDIVNYFQSLIARGFTH